MYTSVSVKYYLNLYVFIINILILFNKLGGQFTYISSMSHRLLHYTCLLICSPGHKINPAG